MVEAEGGGRMGCAVPHSDLYLLYFAGPNEGREWTAESEWDRNMDRKRWSSHDALLYYT